MVFCGVYAHNTPKTPDFTLFHSYYIIETHNSDSTMKKKITNRVSLPVESRIKEATEQTLLTVEQEVELANRIKQGDDEALMDLYNCNLRFVVSVAKQYQNRGKSMEELIEAGNKGLELAAKKFDPQRGFKFIAYAVWFIRASILAFLETSTNDINFSDLTKEEKRELVSKISNERDKEILTRWFGLVDSPESLDDIGESLNLTTTRVQQLRDRAIAKLNAHKDK
jgi:RNA polymerase primary sigma factor